MTRFLLLFAKLYDVRWVCGLIPFTAHPSGIKTLKGEAYEKIFHE